MNSDLLYILSCISTFRLHALTFMTYSTWLKRIEVKRNYRLGNFQDCTAHLGTVIDLDLLHADSLSQVTTTNLILTTDLQTRAKRSRWLSHTRVKTVSCTCDGRNIHHRTNLSCKFQDTRGKHIVRGILIICRRFQTRLIVGTGQAPRSALPSSCFHFLLARSLTGPTGHLKTTSLSAAHGGFRIAISGRTGS